MCLTRVTHVSYWTRVPSLPVFGCLVRSPVVCPPSSLTAAVSELTADVWLWIDLLLLLICPLCPTSMLVPTLVVVDCPTVTRAAEVHSWPACPSLLQTEQCWRHSSRWSCLHQPHLVRQCGGRVLQLSVPGGVPAVDEYNLVQSGGGGGVLALCVAARCARSKAPCVPPTLIIVNGLGTG